MTDAVHIHTRQRVVTEFHSEEGSRSIQIHRCLKSVYGEDATDVSSVTCCVHHFKSGEKDTGDRTYSS
jgi:hypothetical protein